MQPNGFSSERISRRKALEVIMATGHGTVESAKVITDKFTGQSRGFGFVEMSTADEAKKAINALNATQLDGRTLTVNEAKPQEARSGGPKRTGDRGDRGGRW